VEVSFTVGIMSFSFLTLGPLLGLGMKTVRLARDDRASAQIARTLIEEAKQGTLGAGPVYLDDQGAACSPVSAAFVVQPVTQAAGNSASQLTLRVTPVGAPGRARVYAVVLPVAEQN
jgi:2-keto-3-deoxy-6-phosphogluconate aldolase